MLPQELVRLILAIRRAVHRVTEAAQEKVFQLIDFILGKIILWLCRYYERKAGC